MTRREQQDRILAWRLALEQLARAIDFAEGFDDVPDEVRVAVAESREHLDDADARLRDAQRGLDHV